MFNTIIPALDVHPAHPLDRLRNVMLTETFMPVSPGSLTLAFRLVRALGINLAKQGELAVKGAKRLQRLSAPNTPRPASPVSKVTRAFHHVVYGRIGQYGIANAGAPSGGAATGSPERFASQRSHSGHQEPKRSHKTSGSATTSGSNGYSTWSPSGMTARRCDDRYAAT